MSEILRFEHSHHPSMPIRIVFIADEARGLIDEVQCTGAHAELQDSGEFGILAPE